MARRPSGPELLALYRAVLRAHRDALPPPVRPLGDRVAREEFRAHRFDSGASDAQLATFAGQWRAYVATLRGGGGGGGGGGAPAAAEAGGGETIDPSLLGELSPAQQARLARLQAEAGRLGSELLGAARREPGG